MKTMEDYEQAAQAYLESLPPEHFMEATPQSKQRIITSESLDLLKLRIKELQYFNELLVQAELDDGTIVPVVPDTMVILTGEPERKRSSYAMKLEKVKPFWVLEYVSENNKRKDYIDSFRKYEEVLQVPYCLMFDPDKLDLRVWRYNGEGYVLMGPDRRGRVLIDRLDLEAGILEGWVRYWHKGELLPLPSELQQDHDRLKHDLRERDKQISQQADLLQHKDEILADQASQLAARNEQLGQFQQQQQDFLVLIRQQVTERARRAGREDILALVPSTNDLSQLGAWLSELP